MDKLLLCEDCWEDDDLDFESLVLSVHKPRVRAGLQRCQGCNWWGPVKEENGEPVIVVQENKDEFSVTSTTVLDWLMVLAILALSLNLVGIIAYKNAAQPGADLLQAKKSADPEESLRALATFSPISGDSVLGLLDNAHLGTEETKAKLQLLLPLCQPKPIEDRPSVFVRHHIDRNETEQEKGLLSRTISSGHPDSANVCSSRRHGSAHERRTCNGCERIRVMCEWVCDFIYTIAEFFLPATVTLSD